MIRRKYDSSRCPNCGGFIEPEPPVSINLKSPLPHVHIERGRCGSCQVRVHRTEDDLWRIDISPIDERLDEPVLSDDERKLLSKNGSSWTDFCSQRRPDDTLWTLVPKFANHVVIGLVRDGIIVAQRKFRR